jgi:hypothetical protein
MHTDELRREIVAMADVVEPFAGDVRTLHRKRRRNHVVASTLVAIAIAGLAISGVVIAGSKHDHAVQVSDAPSKEVAPMRMAHVDAIVLPASEAVRVALDESSLVSQYARVPREEHPSSIIGNSPWRAAVCALRTSDGYAVEATTRGTDLAAQLSKVLGTRGKAYATADQFGTFDTEINLKVGAPADQAAALRAHLQHDPDVRSFRYISTNDAYAIFKREFRDRPGVPQGLKPSDFQQSFRVIVEPGRSAANLADRYKNLAGVDTVITLEKPTWLWTGIQGAPTTPLDCTGS